MNVWFIRSNTVPLHNDPSNLNEYVPGEPFVNKADYREICLRDGFARIGWPNTGDLRQPGLNRRAPNGAYSFEKLNKDHQTHLRYRSYLIQFASMMTGELVLTPANTGQYNVHLGIIVRRDLKTREIVSTQPGQNAYYYAPYGEFYECAHRVDVLWDSGIHHIEGIAWRLAFCRGNPGVKAAAIQIARKVGLPLPK